MCRSPRHVNACARASNYIAIKLVVVFFIPYVAGGREIFEKGYNGTVSQTINTGAV